MERFVRCANNYPLSHTKPSPLSYINHENLSNRPETMLNMPTVEGHRVQTTSSGHSYTKKLIGKVKHISHKIAKLGSSNIAKGKASRRLDEPTSHKPPALDTAAKAEERRSNDQESVPVSHHSSALEPSLPVTSVNSEPRNDSPIAKAFDPAALVTSPARQEDEHSLPKDSVRFTSSVCSRYRTTRWQ